ncbi:MAG: hypothetical protein AAGA77_09675 [Bacteroidota bacterium]
MNFQLISIKGFQYLEMNSTNISAKAIKSLCFLLVLFSFSSVTAQFDPDDERYNVFGQTVVKTDSTLSIPPVEILSTESGNGTINILINENIHKNFYSSYYIERSTDGVNFTQLNTEPFFFVGPNEDDINKLDPNAEDNLRMAEIRSAVYTDSVADQSIYYYRVIGTNNLGQMSEPSFVVEAKALAPKLNFTMHLDTLVYDANSDDVTIFFPTYPDSIKSNLIGYQMYRSVFHDGPFDPLNTEIVPMTAASYTDIDPMPTGYYVAITWDTEGNEYRTYSYLIQLPDESAPPVPVMVKAEYIEDEKVKITWDEVYAKDLKGYYVYFANGENGEYNPINTSPHKGTEMEHEFKVGMEIDSIFFKVTAIDNRGNSSPSSAPMGIRRPGKFGATNPVIHSITPYTGGKGVVIAYSFSPDKDVKFHKLERRSASNATWMEVARLDPDSQLSFTAAPNDPDQHLFIDSTYIRNEGLEYRLMVTDLDDMVTGSEVVEAFPINSMADGYINDFKLEKKSVPAPLPPLSPFQTQTGNQLPTQMNHTVRLSWIYDDSPRLDGFTIYRGVTGGQLIEYRTVPKDDLEIESASGGKFKFYFSDSSLIGNKRYLYKVMARHLDGTTSHMSNAISVKVK